MIKLLYRDRKKQIVVYQRKIFSSKINDKNEFQIVPIAKEVDHKTQLLWGTYRSLINNAVTGVSIGHEKILELNGIFIQDVLLKVITFALQTGFSLS